MADMEHERGIEAREYHVDCGELDAEEQWLFIERLRSIVQPRGALAQVQDEPVRTGR